MPRASRKVLGELIELAPDVVVLFDRDGIIKYASPALERVTGFRAEEVIGRYFEEFVAPGDSAPERFAKMLGTVDVVTGQSRVRRRDGSWATLEIFGRNYLAYPELRGILVFMRDVSHHVALEATLRKSARESGDLFEHAPCGYHSVDENGVFLRVNAMELEWLQRGREELVGKMRFADFLAEAARPAYWEAFALLKKQKAVRNAEFDVVRKDGSTFPALMQSVAIMDRKGRFVESRTTVYDVTERKRSERALARVNRALKVLGDARKHIIFASSESDLLEEICRVLVEHGGYRFAAVHFVQHDPGSTMRLVARAGEDRGYLEAMNLTWADTAPGQGPIGMAVRTGAAEVNQNYATNSRVAPWREFALRCGFHSSVSVPLKDPRGVFGTLSVFAPEPDGFDCEELRLFEQLADELSFALGSLLAQKFAGEHGALKGPTGEKDPLRALSHRERQVLERVVEGLSSKEIAARLGIAPTSVDTYRSRLMFKLDVTDVTGLVRFAIRHGVIQP